MANWTEETAQITTIDDHGDVRIVNVRRLVPDDPREKPVQLEPLVEDIGYHDDDDEIDEKIERTHRHLTRDAAARKKRAKALIKDARQGVTPRISKAEHERLQAADQAAREMEVVRRELLGPEQVAESRNASADRKGG